MNPRAFLKMAVPGLLMAALGFGTLSGSFTSARASFFESKDGKVYASFSGFEPGTRITGRLTGDADVALTSTANVGDKGAADLKMKPEALGPSAPLLYDFSLKNNNRNLDLSIKYNSDSNTFSLTGKGVKPLSRIVMETAKGSVETKSDWAGLFTQDSIEFDPREKEQSFQIAFYGSYLSDAQRGLSPNIVKVAIAVTTYGNAHVNDIQANYIDPLRFMALEFSTLMWQQALIIGQFFDAKEQLEAQRVMQALKAQAFKDYHPSDQMCRFGTFTRSLATTEAKMNLDHLAFTRIMMLHAVNEEYAASEMGPDSFNKAQHKKFREENCDEFNNNYGLDRMCEHDQDGIVGNDGGLIGAQEFERTNADISYTSTLDIPHTLEVDFTDEGELTDIESDLVSLAKNLYWQTPFEEAVNIEADDPNSDYDPELQRKVNYMKARRMMAVMNVAQNSFASLVAMKARAVESDIEYPGWAYMKTMMREFGLPDDEIERLIGEFPSYYAQMDVLTKKIYQNPNFYTNLYDKPVNVDRMSAAMEAIKLMQARDFYDSYTRKEMLVSSNLEEELDSKVQAFKGQLLDTDVITPESQ